MKKIIKKIKEKRYFILLSIFSVILLASVVRYAWRTFQIPVWDEQHYMQMAAEFYRLLQNPTLNTPYEMMQVLPFRQPGYPLAITPFLLLFGLSNSYFWGIVTNGIFYVVTVIGIYFLAKQFFSKQSALLASIMFASYGWVLFHVHTAYSEISATAMSLLATLFLVKSDYFRKRSYTILFGLCLGYGILIRWVSIVFILGPLIYVIYQMIKKQKIFSRKLLVNIALAFVVMLIIVLPYFFNSGSIFQYFNGHRFGGEMWKIVPEEERNPLSIYSLTFYLSSFEKLGIFNFILLVFGFILGFKKKSNYEMMLAAVIVPWIFFSFFSILKADRFIVPIYPFIAIISAAIFDKIKNHKAKILLVIVAIVLSSLSFLGSAWGKGPMSASLSTLPVTLPFGELNKIHLTSISRPPYIYKLSGREIIAFLEKDSDNNIDTKRGALMLFSYRPLDEPLMTYNLFTLIKPFVLNSYLGSVITDPELQGEGLLKEVFGYDYILVKSGKISDEYFPRINYLTLEAFQRLFTKYVQMDAYYEKKTEIWINQDSSIVTIWKKKKEVPAEERERLKPLFIEELQIRTDH